MEKRLKEISEYFGALDQTIVKVGASVSSQSNDEVSLIESSTWNNSETQSVPFDLVLRCQDRTYFVHRQVLLRQSPLFAASMMEVNGKLSVLNLSIVASKDIEVILKYAYSVSGDVFRGMTFCNLFNLLMTARLLKIAEVEECIRREMWKMHDLEFLMSLWDLSRDIKYDDAITDIINYIVKNIRIFTKSQLFARLHWQHLREILTMANQEDEASAKGILKLCVQWLCVDLKERKEFIHKIRHFLVFQDFSSELNYSSLQQFTPAYQQIPRCKANAALLERNIVLPACLVFAYKDDEIIFVKMRLMGGDKWLDTIQLELSRQLHLAIVSESGRLFIIGGNDKSMTRNTKCSAYHYISSQIQPLADLNYSRLGAGVAWHKSFIYAIGGLDKTFGKMSYLDSVERLCPDLQCSKWEVVSPLHNHRAFPGVVATKNYIYVIGGSTTSCERYNIARNKWSQLIPLPARYGSSAMLATRYQNKILAVRQWDNSEIYILNLKTSSSSIVPAFGQVPRDIVACTVLNNEMWAIDQEGVFFKCNICRSWWERTNTRYPGTHIRHALFVNFRGLEGLFIPGREDNSLRNMPAPNLEFAY